MRGAHVPVIEAIKILANELVAFRHDLHQHPELGFQEYRTAKLVAEKLRTWGIEVHTGIGTTGVVGVLNGVDPEGRTIGLRADMDALPMEEETELPYRSVNAGVFHGCGHDGHTTMLLGAARYLSQARNFKGKVLFIFQPAEEGLGGARAMLRDGLFQRFPCDEIYGLHNSPYDEAYSVGIKIGTAMAGADFFDLRVNGRGSHGAMPEASRDPLIVVASLVQSLQTVVSRNISPLKSAVVSVTQVHSGSAYNVIPETAIISGTIRYFDSATRDVIADRIRTICAGTGATFEVDIDVEIRNVFDVLVNDEKAAHFYAQAAREIVGSENVRFLDEPVMGSEDFADMLYACPGAYCIVGHQGSTPLHNPKFQLDDGILPVGASILARVAEMRLCTDTGPG